MEWRWGFLLCLLTAACGGGSPAPSNPAHSSPAERDEESAWTATPSAGGPWPPFELVAQEIHRSGASTGQIQHTIGPGRRLALIGDSGARWTVYDIDSGWARVSRRWTRRIEGDWSQGFDPTGRSIFVIAEDACVFDLERDAESCVSRNALGYSGTPIAGLAPGGGRLLYVVFEDLGQREWEAELRAWVPGEAQSQRVLALPGFARSGEWLSSLDGAALTYASQGARAALTNVRDTWLIDTSSDTWVTHIQDRISCTPPFDPSGRWLAVASDEAFELRDAGTGALRHRIAMEAPPRAIAWAADGQTVAFCVGDGEARRVNTETGAIEPVAVEGCPDTELLVRGQRVRASSPLIEHTTDEFTDIEALVVHGRTRTLWNSGELSIWGVDVAADSAETARRRISEHWGRDGMRVAGGPAWAGPADGTVVGTSASERVRLERGDDDGVLRLRQRGGGTVALQDPLPVNCYDIDDTSRACNTTPVFSPDESVVVITAPHRAATYDVASGRRLGLLNLQRRPRPCTTPCGGREYCVDGECTGYAAHNTSLAFSPSGERLVAMIDTRTYLYDLAGERLATLAPAAASASELHQLYAFSSDNAQLAFARRQTLQLLNPQDGARRSEITLPEPLRFMVFSADASTLAVVTLGDRLLQIRVADGSVTDVGVIEGLRGLGAPAALAVVCSEGMVHLRRLFTGAVRGPLGRCPSRGNFVVGSTGAFVGYYGGTLARIHRVSDGEVLNLRAVTRRAFDEEEIWRPLPTHLLAFSDSGWFDMNGGQPIHLRVRDGAALDAEMASPRGNPHRREGLVEAFFSGQRLAAQPASSQAEE